MRSVLLLVMLASMCCACGGNSSNTQAADLDHTGSVAGNLETQLDDDAARWNNLIAKQAAGEGDFDSRQIMVVYRDLDELEPIGQDLISESRTASTKANACLRVNKNYEPITDAIAAACDITIRQQVYTGNLNIASFDVPEGKDANQALSQIRDGFSGQVGYALFSPIFRAQYTPNDPVYNEGSDGSLWDRWRIHCSAGWEYTMGDPDVIIAVVDTGVRMTHEDLGEQVIDPQVGYPSATCDLVNDDNSIEDVHGHGTFIAGIIAGTADNELGIIGVAPKCRVLPIKISNYGECTTADMVAGCILAANLGVQVINLSFGQYLDVPAVENMVNLVSDAGVLLVGAAGNDSLYSCCYPGAYDNAICVGATDKTDVCAYLSNRGTDVNIAAPGIFLASTSFMADDRYGYNWEGTSFAAPMVAATAGLLWSFEPTLTLAEVRDAIENHGYSAYGFQSSIKRVDVTLALYAIVEPVTPTVAGISIADESIWGAVPAQQSIAVQLVGATDVTNVTYTLDLAPLGLDSGEDVHQQSVSGPLFPVQFNTLGLPNQTAMLSVTYKSLTNTEGTPIDSTLYIFNQIGDVNGDGVVDGQDHLAYLPVIGLKTGQENYLPFFDTDQDGTITELDASAVGYFFSGS